ncbi:uncharacterized protein LOC114350926 [Ostrinia furnacalis]|uniref:uncharacterized protein LOC114350926 n=1 Tax=Ostrinia furnacalis TaxID=93504 RepID=UPI00103ADC38|nr:uncharacterized protein LOC114350926 [Ostrinia furnacalis]
MLCILVLLVLLKPYATSTNVGTTLFFNRRTRADCWHEDDVAKLRARKMFQQVMPPPVTPDKINARYIKDTLRYYRGALRATEMIHDHHTSVLLKEALADAIGGYLNSQMLPTVRFAYYAGYVPYRSARELHDFLENIKTFLNTKGLGWKEPDKVPQWSNLTVVKVLIGSGRLFDPCSCLVTKRDSSACIHLPAPKLDDIYEPSAVALPFKVGGLVSLASANSENILLKYYTTASRCILRSSPENCRHSDFVNFNNELWHWMKRDVAPHLVDDKLYGAYGGILRIAAAVQSYGKGLSRRNLFEYQDAGVSKWHPWQALTQSYVYINADWTPKLYVGMVVLAAIAICLLQICYNYMFGDAKGCHCTGRSKSFFTKEVAYANVDSNFPAMLPAHDTSKFSDKNRHKLSSAKTKSSAASMKTQRVYDLNDNAEKLMEVIISGNEDTESESPYLSKQEESEEADNVINLAQSKRSKSPPELHTPIAQLRLEKPQLGRSVPMYSTSTATHSEVTYCQEQQVSESAWSGSGSSSSEDHTATSDSSKTKSRKTRESRDIAWARRVVSKHMVHSNTRSTTGTEFDLNSFTTPPSRR